MQELIIVGADPGINFGIAILDLEKKLLYLSSIRNLGISGACKIISKFGKPIFIATDKSKVPSKILRIAAAFHVPVWSPSEDMKLATKQKLVESYAKANGLELIPDKHAIDALAAALSAYQSISSTLSNIDKNLFSKGLSRYAKNVKYLILTKSAQNISNALRILELD